ncbi:MAG: beta galactosidase jelly roll domain-containing protein, partial [Bacteroidota bacterium]|nr:beta galactosidase jelly roll domain-containing protein [Bacteroidota bacterium]
EHRDEMKLAVQLPNLWKFKTGDDKQWADPSTDDSKWQTLVVPLPWDYQGYEEYDGFGWYRVTFDVPDNLQNEKLFVVLGKVDDIDEAYLNGTKIGNTGRMEGRRWIDNIQEQYRELRVYRIPSSIIKYNQKNVIALRVYDKMRYGGICEGPIGIINEREYKRLNLNDEIRRQNDKSKFERWMDIFFKD